MRENLKYWLFANNGFWITVSIVIDILQSVMLFIVCSIKSKFILTEYCLNMMSFIHKKKTYLENTMLQLKEKSPKVTLYKGLSNTSTFARLLSFEVKEQTPATGKSSCPRNANNILQKWISSYFVTDKTLYKITEISFQRVRNDIFT